jgi:hypothetical protein
MVRFAGFLGVMLGAGAMLWVLGPRLALLPMLLLTGPAVSLGPLLRYGNEGLAAIVPATPGVTLTLAGFVLCCVLVLTLARRGR